MSVSLEEAYASCEAIARHEARNFYYAFRVLPKAKRSAICAVYAFMRHADDLADDERHSHEERLRQTQQWLEAWHRAARGEESSNPVFVALRDTQRRFGISTGLLDQLLQGTRMDLTESRETISIDPARPVAVYSTFDDLYQYCYYVASVVGLVCIRIFEYSDSRAEKLAEETGIAFQLTNILRDVREDVERGRLYLPLEDLRSCKVTLEQITKMHGQRKLSPEEHELMKMEGERAHKYYSSADALLPLIAPDSRAALWVLVRIYRRLLVRIEDAGYDVFSGKIRVPTHEKIKILLIGVWMAFRLRIA